MPPTLKAAIYCRVSTDDQEREGTSLQTQQAACEEYCQRKGYNVTHRFIEAYSGLTLDRPKLRDLQGKARSHDFDVIVIYCLDRMTRNPTHGVILGEDFTRLGIKLEAVTETIESSELGKLISYVKGYASNLEAERIKERTMRGKMAHVKAGKLPQGTGIGVYGYQWNKDTGRRTIIEHEAKTVLRIFADVIAGKSVNSIALSLNKDEIPTKSGSLWFPLTVRRIALNSTYAGLTYYGQTKRVGKNKVIAQPKENWVLLPDVTPPIITQEMFNKAQEAIKNRHEVRPLKQNAAYLLTGFMRCPKCGSTIGGTMLSGKYRYYQCRGSKPTATRAKICDAGYIKADEIEENVWYRLISVATEPLKMDGINTTEDDSTNLLPILDKQIKELRVKLKAYPQKEKNLYGLLTHEQVTSEYVLEAVSKLKERLAEDEQQLKGLVETRKRIGASAQIALSSEQKNSLVLEKLFEATTIEDRRRWLQAMRVKIIAQPGSFKMMCFYDAKIDYADFLENPDADLESGDPMPDVNQPVYADYAKSVKDLVTIERTSGCAWSYEGDSIPFQRTLRPA
ncbi:site-specific DNA recombinase [Dehalogenimonas formicexedens]|uniref:Site-specific DNA recombinase n=2 Tax=Dehalogenimonas formicexedens TaxID=1839801 RepID=A0A1P8F611_9CHLR|nr:site-specific DNA recombinase [Dehalogenimonas formicexedens]